MQSHAIHWFEIPAADMARAVAFYEAVFQVQLRRENIGADLAVFPTQGDSITGCLIQGPKSVPSTTGTLVYLDASPSMDATLERVAAAGGMIVVPKTALPPGMGFFAVFDDCEGNRVGLHADS
jgi:predicted enzyme related to lactoylglutathione lyase